MIGQGQNKTQVFTRKKGWAAPARRTGKKGKKGKREKQTLLGCGLFADEFPDGVGHDSGIFVGSVHLR